MPNPGLQRGRGNLLWDMGSLAVLLCIPVHLLHPDSPQFLQYSIYLPPRDSLPGTPFQAHPASPIICSGQGPPALCGWGTWWSLLYGRGTLRSLPGVFGEAERSWAWAGAGGDVRGVGASLCVESQEGECGPRGQQQVTGLLR